MEDIILLGIGGHAHSVVDSIEQSGKYHIVGFLDREEQKDIWYKDYKVIGTDDMLQVLYKQGIRNAFVTVGYMGMGNIRQKLYTRIKEIGFQIPNIIDNTAIVAQNVLLGEGNFIGKRVIVNAGAQIGNMCILNSASVIEHDCRVADFSHIAVGSVLCGGVRVGKSTLIGANSVIIQEVLIGNEVVIGAGSTIIKNVADNTVKYGKIERE